jgi:AcrR family transcriptional regulator
MTADARTLLLDRVLTYAAADGVADKSLREIAAGVGTSHRMLLYHFGSREGLLAAVVGAVEAQQRAVLSSLVAAGGPAGGAELMLRLWDQVSDPGVRPFVRLFFAAVGLAVQGVPGTQVLLDTLTEPWLQEAGEAGRRLGLAVDPAALRLGVAASRGLLLELLAGADPDEVTASYRLFVEMWQHWSAASGEH